MMKRFLLSLLALSLAAPLTLCAEDGGKHADKPKGKGFKGLDTDGDKKISLAEFKADFKGKKPEKADDKFKAGDKDADGFWSVDEFKAVAEARKKAHEEKKGK